MKAHRSSRRGRTATALAALLGFGVVLAACGSSSPSAAPPSTSSSTTTTTSTSSSTTTTTTGSGSVTSELKGLSSLATTASGATFQATYAYTESGSHQSLVFAQSPPKWLFKGSQAGYVVNTGSGAYYCSRGTCYESASLATSSILYLFDGKTFETAAAEYGLTAAYLAAHGISLAFSAATYAGQASKCVTITQSTSSVKTVTWCVADNGMMTNWQAGNNSFTLTAFTSSPPSSDFALPPGAKVTTAP